MYVWEGKTMEDYRIPMCCVRVHVVGRPIRKDLTVRRPTTKGIAGLGFTIYFMHKTCTVSRSLQP